MLFDEGMQFCFFVHYMTSYIKNLLVAGFNVNRILLVLPQYFISLGHSLQCTFFLSLLCCSTNFPRNLSLQMI